MRITPRAAWLCGEASSAALSAAGCSVACRGGERVVDDHVIAHGNSEA